VCSVFLQNPHEPYTTYSKDITFFFTINILVFSFLPRINMRYVDTSVFYNSQKKKDTCIHPEHGRHSYFLPQNLHQYKFHILSYKDRCAANRIIKPYIMNMKCGMKYKCDAFDYTEYGTNCSILLSISCNLRLILKKR
jgi:hypothetical protein